MPHAATVARLNTPAARNGSLLTGRDLKSGSFLMLNNAGVYFRQRCAEFHMKAYSTPFGFTVLVNCISRVFVVVNSILFGDVCDHSKCGHHSSFEVAWHSAVIRVIACFCQRESCFSVFTWLKVNPAHLFHSLKGDVML